VNVCSSAQPEEHCHNVGCSPQPHESSETLNPIHSLTQSSTSTIPLPVPSGPRQVLFHILFISEVEIVVSS